MASASIPPTTLTNTYATVLTVAAGQTWRIQFSAVSNSGTSAQDLFVQIVDSSSSTTRLLVPGTPIPAKFKIDPLFEGDLVLNPGDQIQARGPTTGAVTLHMFLTYNDGQG